MTFSIKASEPEGLSWHDVAVVMWVSTALNILLTVGRYHIRFVVHRHFYCDDFAHLVALITSIAASIITQVEFGPASELVSISPGTVPSKDAATKFIKQQVIRSIFAYTSLYAVKFSFLLFYKRLFWVSSGFRKGFWAVAVFSFVGFWVSIAGILTQCGPAKDVYNIESCISHKHYQRTVYIYLCAFGTSTDLAVMTLPMFMLHKLSGITTGQKLGMGLLFSVAFVTIALDILRTVEGIRNEAFGNNILYAVLEINFTVLISCAPTYRALVGLKRRIRDRKYAHWGSGNETQRKSSDGIKSVLLHSNDGTSIRESSRDIEVESADSNGHHTGQEQHVLSALPPMPPQVRIKLDGNGLLD